MSGASQGRGRGRGKPPKVPSVSTRVQGEHSPLPSSKCGDPSLPSAHHPPALAGAQPLSEAMCLPPSVSSSGQQLQFQIPAPLQPQAPLATAGSSGGQGGFKKGLKAKWMQDTELDRTRKERDDEEEAKRKELARKQLEETAARQLLEQEQAASVAALALAEQQRLQKQEEAAAAEAAREQEELVAKAAAQAKLDLQIQQEAEVKQQQEVELRKQQRLDAELKRQQQQQEAELKQQQEAEIRLQQEQEAEARKQQEAKLKRQQELERQQQEEQQQQARKTKEDQDRKLREDAAKRAASIKALALLSSSSNRSRSGIDDFEDSMFTALPSSRAPAIPRVPETPSRSTAPSPSAATALNHQANSSLHDGSKISPRPSHASPAAASLPEPSSGGNTTPPPPSLPQLDRSSSKTHTGPPLPSLPPPPPTNKTSLPSSIPAPAAPSTGKTINKQPSVTTHTPSEQAKQTSLPNSFRSSSGPLPSAPTLHRSLSSATATAAQQLAIASAHTYSSTDPIPSDPFDLLGSDPSPSVTVNHPVTPKTSLPRPSPQQLPTGGGSCSMAADAPKHSDIRQADTKQSRLDRNMSTSALEPNGKKLKREEPPVSLLRRTGSKAKLVEAPELEEWEQVEPLQCTKAKRPRLSASCSANDFADTHLLSALEASPAAGIGQSQQPTPLVHKSSTSALAKYEGGGEASAAAVLPLRDCSDISTRSGISVPGATKLDIDMEVDLAPTAPIALKKVVGNGTVGNGVARSEKGKQGGSGAAVLSPSSAGPGKSAKQEAVAAVQVHKLKGRPPDRTPRPSTDSSVSPSPGGTPPPDFHVSGLKLEASNALLLAGSGPKAAANGPVLVKQNSVSSLEHDFDAEMADKTPHASDDEKVALQQHQQQQQQQQRPGKSKKLPSSNTIPSKGSAASCLSPTPTKDRAGPAVLTAQPEQRKKAAHGASSQPVSNKSSQPSPTNTAGAGLQAGKSTITPAAAGEPAPKRSLSTHAAGTSSQQQQQQPRKSKHQGGSIGNRVCAAEQPSPEPKTGSPEAVLVMEGWPPSRLNNRNDSPQQIPKQRKAFLGQSQGRRQGNHMDVDEGGGGMGFQDARLAAAAAARHAAFSDSSELEERESSESEGAGSHGQGDVVRSTITLGGTHQACNNMTTVYPSHSVGDFAAGGGCAPDDCMAGASWAGSHPHMPHHHTPGDHNGGGGLYNNSRRSSGGGAATTTGLRGGGGRLSDGNQRVMPVASTTSSHPRPEAVLLQPRVVQVLVDGVDTLTEESLSSSTQHRTVDLSRIRSFKEMWVVLEAILGEALPPGTDAKLVFLDDEGDWLMVLPEESWLAFVNTARKLMITY